MWLLESASRLEPNTPLLKLTKSASTPPALVPPTTTSGHHCPKLRLQDHLAGCKVFMLSCRTPTGERRKLSLGTYGQINVDQARKLANNFPQEV